MLIRAVSMLCGLFAWPLLALAQPSVPTLTYQGRLAESGSPVTYPIDVQFWVFDAPSAGTSVNLQQLVPNITPDANGNFTAEFSLANAFSSPGERYLEVQVSPAGQNTWTTLSPRRRLTHTPYAVRSVTADTATTSTQLNGQPASFYQSATNLTSGTLPSARLSGTYSGVLNLSSSSNTIVGTHSGNGAGLTSLNATNILSGTVNDARLSANVALLNRTAPFQSQVSVGGPVGGYFQVSGPAGTGGSLLEEQFWNTLPAVTGETSAWQSFTVHSYGLMTQAGMYIDLTGTGVRYAWRIRRGVGTSGPIVLDQPSAQPCCGDSFYYWPIAVPVVPGDTFTIEWSVTQGTAIWRYGEDNPEGTCSTGAGDLAVYFRVYTPSTTAPVFRVSSSGTEVLSGVLSGDGSGLTGVDAATLGGSAASAFATLAGANTFAGANVFNSTVGVGTASPEAPLHVFASSAGAVTADPNSVAVLERNGNSYLTFLSPSGSARGIVFGDPTSATTGSILYNPTTATNGIDMRANGNVSRMTITSAGNVGIANTSPGSRLHVRGDGTGGRLSIDPGASNLNCDIGLFENTSNTLGFFLRYDGTGTNQFQIVGLNSGPTEVVMATFDRDTNQVVVNGSLGIGTGTEAHDAPLHISAAGRLAKLSRVGSDGELLAWARDDTVIGSVTVASGVVAYGAFTGVHYAELDGDVRVGDLVTLTGDNTTLGGRDPAETVYGVRTTAKANDPAVLGVYVGSLPAESFGHRKDVAQIAAVGNGEMWVVDGGEDISPGDYLISSGTPGCAMRDDPERFEIGHVIASAAGRVTWNEIKAGPDGVKRARVSVLFDKFSRTPPGLSERVRRLEELLGQR